ncbi:MAG: Xaa-Pro peptidase family protein [Armatimonadota bacterium]|nr:Xaa-Pro peptidase family protein [Armatimonadota bacterium]
MSAKNKPPMPYDWGRVPYTYADRLPWMNLPFPVEEYHERLDRIRARMRQDGLDCLVVLGNRADTGNVRYLSNFEDFYGGDTIIVIPVSGPPGFTTNAVMHGEPMHSGIQDCWIEDVRCAAAPRTVTGSAAPATIYDHVEDFITERGCATGTIGVEGEFNVEELIAFLSSTFPAARVKAARGLLRAMRAIKSRREVEALRRAAHLADVAMQAAMEGVKPGVSEVDLAAEANYAMFKAGAEHPAFAIALTAGPRSGFKHMAPTRYQIRRGDVVYIDVGGRYMGYYSDCSRQRTCGEPNGEQLRFMETQIRIVEEVMAAARPGAVIGDLAKIGIAIADAAGYGQYLYFRGHGIGCAVQDLPAFAPGNPAVLQENMVFCFEPMLVRKEFGTACWEDMWWVTSTGVERLNECQVRWW